MKAVFPTIWNVKLLSYITLIHVQPTLLTELFMKRIALCLLNVGTVEAAYCDYGLCYQSVNIIIFSKLSKDFWTVLQPITLKVYYAFCKHLFIVIRLSLGPKRCLQPAVLLTISSKLTKPSPKRSH